MMSLVCVPNNWDCMCLLEYGLVLALFCRLWDLYIMSQPGCVSCVIKLLN